MHHKSKARKGTLAVIGVGNSCPRRDRSDQALQSNLVSPEGLGSLMALLRAAPEIIAQNLDSVLKKLPVVLRDDVRDRARLQRRPF